jgi:hypothetical protein
MRTLAHQQVVDDDASRQPFNCAWPACVTCFAMTGTGYSTCSSSSAVPGVFILVQSQASGNLHIATWKDAQATARSFISNNIWRAPIAACALGGLMVVLFNLLSCIVLIRQAVLHSAAASVYVVRLL